jgi:mono/diheme cytochrome c family protein
VPRQPTFLVVAGCAVFAASLFAQGPTPAAQGAAASSADPTASRQMFQRYCSSCHNSKLKTGGLALDALDLNAIDAHPQAWEKVVTKLRTGAMPPAGLPRPDAATYDTVATWLESRLDAIAAASPNPGVRPSLHRLNRTEYKNAVRDLLALDDLPRELDIDILLPADDASYGFDNIADALGTSPSLLERYLVAAQKISRVAVGDRSMPMIVDTYRVPSQLPQEDRLEGYPFGTRGGIKIERHFPLDGEYVFRVALGGGRSQDRHHLELLVDGERAHVFTIEGRGGRGRGGAPAAGPAPGAPGAVTPGALAAAGMDQSGSNIEVRRPVTAGHHVVIATFVKKSSAVVEDTLRPFTRTGQANAPAQPSLASLTITGPLTIAGSGDTSSRRRLFSCHPTRGAQESACAREVLTSLARRAYRRPVTDADLQTLMPFYEAGRADGGFEAGIQRALERVLVSPSFLFRVERDPAAAAVRSRPSTASADAPRPRAARISDVELASRLSFFLWSSIPDDELLEAAARGALANPAELERQVKRMMADPRAARWSTISRASGSSFATSTALRPIRACSRTSTRRSGGRCVARPSCSSTTRSPTTAASWSS